MLCQICNEKESKYKCPKCLINYCSLICFKEHQGRDLCKQVPKENVNISTSDEKDSIQPLLSKSVEEFTLPENILSKLYESEKIVKLLKSKKLQDLLKYIASADDKEEILRNQMKNNEDFNEFVDLLLEQIGVRKDGMSILS